MHVQLNIASAPNTTNPCLVILRQKGYHLKVIENTAGACLYVAKHDGRRIVADSAAELLGLVTMWEHFGDGWQEKLPTLEDVMSEIDFEPNTDE